MGKNNATRVEVSAKKDWQPSVIKFMAVATATPRWVGALLAAEGLAIAPDWAWWWLPVSAICSAGMAAVEGWAFAYIFTAYRAQQGQRKTRWLMPLTIISALIFIVVLTPYIAASASGKPFSDLMSNPWLLWPWSISVGASTIAIVASVGYAQKQAKASAVQTAEQPKQIVEQAEQVIAKALLYPCKKCDRSFDTQKALNGHMSKHKLKITDNINGNAKTT